MTTIRYFAYGSNMLAERLLARCPSARSIGTARAIGFDLSFAKRSTADGSGKAMLTASDKSGATVHGVLFNLDTADLSNLDRLEGVGHGYRRENGFKVFAQDDQLVVAATYMADPDYVDPNLLPYDWYVNIAIADARQHRLPSSYIDMLVAVSTVADPSPDRQSRQDALTLLKQLEVAG
jgi:gamma-glutamylcyclotransferase